MNTNSKELPPEDIDLLALAERTIVFFRKFKWLFLVAVILGLALGYVTYSRLPRVYQSRMILHSFTLSNEDYIQVIDNYNRLLKRNEWETLSQEFNIPRKVIAQTKQIKAYQIQKVFTPNNPNGFYVDVYVTDNAILPDLQKGIIYGLEHIDFIRKQLDIKKQNFTLLIADVKNEIAKLDSTKTEVENSLQGKGHSSSLLVDITGLNKQRIELNEKLLNYEQEIQFLNAVQVLQGFSAFARPAGPNLFVWLGLGLIAGLVIAYLLAIFLTIRNRLNLRDRVSP